MELQKKLKDPEIFETKIETETIPKIRSLRPSEPFIREENPNEDRIESSIRVQDSLHFFQGKEIMTEEELKLQSLPEKIKFDVERARQRKKETQYEKYQRLKYEIESFTKELEEVKKEDEQILQKISIQNLQDLLKQMETKLEEVKNQVFTPNKNISSKLSEQIKKFPQNKEAAKPSKPETKQIKEDVVSYDLIYSDSLNNLTEETFLFEVEKQIIQLENIVGINQSKEQFVQKEDINTLVKKLKEKISLLDSIRLVKITKKIQLASRNLEVFDEQIEKDETLENSQKKVAELYEKMKEWDKVAQKIPSIISRLHYYKDLHDKQLALISRVIQLENEHKNLSESLSSNVQILEKLKKTFEENITTMKQNISLLEKRIQSISKK
ncbi:dynactin subunit [Anaeramoeba ignava]|uniref:Dynactin subunit n=1 Tax=Anaeramoeba ignava TaxID=1746090 RepID=A0A9Q0LWC2_ANAIG|nr:dynactin subunit [Anaeramoeba ignava]|eukprot:Anaeramoba_ignava/a221533_47.p1 GENE.a221533_47~~a221533_47.p1  ORF type:complete len:383 (-),score=173.93 a221533_47:181-1329(-)